jgi:hypothetical protein
MGVSLFEFPGEVFPFGKVQDRARGGDVLGEEIKGKGEV